MRTLIKAERELFSLFLKNELYTFPEKKACFWYQWNKEFYWQGTSALFLKANCYNHIYIGNSLNKSSILVFCGNFFWIDIRMLDAALLIYLPSKKGNPATSSVFSSYGTLHGSQWKLRDCAFLLVALVAYFGREDIFCVRADDSNLTSQGSFPGF